MNGCWGATCVLKADGTCCPKLKNESCGGCWGGGACWKLALNVGAWNGDDELFPYSARILSFVNFPFSAPFSIDFWLKKSSSSCFNESLLPFFATLFCTWDGCDTVESEKKSNVSLIEFSVFCCTADGNVVTDAVWFVWLTDDVSSPSKSADADVAVTVTGAIFGTTFLTSDREFFGECGFGKGAGIILFVILGVVVFAVGSGNDDVDDVDFFLRFWFSSSSSISLSQSTKNAISY